MTENVENLILEHLKALRNELRKFQSDTRAEFKDVKQRLHRIDVSILTMKRVQRIERRLEIQGP